MVHTAPAPAPFAELDGKRIAGNVGVISLHGLVFAVLMMPSSWQAPAAIDAEPPPVVIEEIVKPEPIRETEPPPPRIEQIRERPRPEVPPRVVEPEAPPVSDAPVFPDGEIYAPPEGEVGPLVDTFEPAAPALVELALDVHPSPRYPRNALRRGEEGLVVLRVRVDEGGHPVEVTIEQSSGHRELDRAARDTVADRWRFRPAMRDGRAVGAWGLVPVRFVLP
ncbi:energy transducer TonB [Arenimonas composti]|uniref:TonB C-terminal domain-containing protein n=1 Tax=Arenimonas composti TR7-09 = DSM 18010 TaxID=1121013 RepID=A0A091BC61_9GAMM|nr:energy transducer TonB [Arenimonas composti]KFN50263.1 hypothetical protein P873_07855 [Arenimonas composti TR7-09 = DSM 18010]